MEELWAIKTSIGKMDVAWHFSEEGKAVTFCRELFELGYEGQVERVTVGDAPPVLVDYDGDLAGP